MTPPSDPPRRRWPSPGPGLIWMALAAVLAGGVFALYRSGEALPGASETPRFFRIATGSTADAYFPIGQLLASIISHPPGAEACNVGGRCGVPGLIAVTKTSPGSIANVRAVNAGQLESGLAQTNIAAWAFNGEETFAGEPPMDKLRIAARLYPEAVHLVARYDAHINTVADLRGKRISVNSVGSGTRTDALLILNAYGLGPEDVTAVSVDASRAADMILAGELDAFFLVSGTPAASVADLARRGAIDLVPIDGEPAQKLRARHRFFTPATIPAGTYKYIGDVRTMAVSALWIVSADLDEGLVHDMVGALFDPANLAVLTAGHPQARHIRLEDAVTDAPILLHPGAERFYMESGVLVE